jgi:hypothetical protein
MKKMTFHKKLKLNKKTTPTKKNHIRPIKISVKEKKNSQK